VKLLIDELHQSIALNNSLNASLREEINNSKLVRVKLEKDVEHIKRSLEALEKIIHNTDGASIPTRLALLESGVVKGLPAKLTQIEGQLTSLNNFKKECKEAEIRRGNKFWMILVQNSPVILTWIGLLIWALVNMLNK